MKLKKLKSFFLQLKLIKLYTAKEAYLALYNKTKEQFDKSDEALTKVKERLAELEAMVKELETLEQEQQS